MLCWLVDKFNTHTQARPLASISLWELYRTGEVRVKRLSFSSVDRFVKDANMYILVLHK